MNKIEVIFKDACCTCVKTLEVGTVAIYIDGRIFCSDECYSKFNNKE